MTNRFKKQQNDPKSGRVISIPLSQIHPNPHQPRKHFDSVSLESLAESLRRHGMLQPMTVRAMDEPSEIEQPLCAAELSKISLIRQPRYEIVAGERRYRAAGMIGMSEVPCILLPCTETESAQLALIENIQRQDLDPFEEAAAIASLLDLEPMTQEQIAKRLSVSQSYIANKLRLLRLTDEERELILSSHLTERHARALLKITDPASRIKVLRTVIEKGYNVAQTESAVSIALNPPSSPSLPNQPRIVVRDLRVFYNTIEHAVLSIARAGVQVTQERRENASEVEYVIRMPK